MRSRKSGVGILGMGVCLPEKVLTNFDIEKMVDTSDDWIVTRTGIRERRLVRVDQATSDLALPAAKGALGQAGVSAEEVDLIIVATTTPDMLFPSTACLIQRDLGATKAGAFDLSAACAGFVYALNLAYATIASGQYKYVLVIGADALSKMMDWTDRSTCVLFGDGAGAALLGPVPGGRGVIATHVGSDGRYAKQLMMPAGGSRLPSSHETVDKKLHTVKMNGNEVFKMAVRIMVDATRVVVQKAGLNLSDIDCVVPHQANLRIIQAAIERLGIPPEKFMLNLERYGNMSAASTVVALYEAVEERKIQSGSKVALVSFGSGLAWASCVMVW
ncbi:MAG: ketoacyl-ACP synthase III [Candidatus Omnitrophica bacterium]|nr:ketoacyl-ACP synthase III [Candidatus Omnitrophota bacterium]